MKKLWTILVVDVETSGHLRTYRGITPYHNLLEIGGVLVELGKESKIVDEIYIVLKPITDYYDPKAIVHTSGKTFDYYKNNGIDPKLGIKKFYNFVLKIYNKTRKKVLFASDNPEFDVGWIRLYLEIFGYDHRIIHHNPMSIKDLARGLTKNIWMNLYKLPQKYSVGLPHTHRAIDDARRNAHILMNLAVDLFP